MTQIRDRGRTITFHQARTRRAIHIDCRRWGLDRERAIDGRDTTPRERERALLHNKRGVRRRTFRIENEIFEDRAATTTQ